MVSQWSFRPLVLFELQTPDFAWKFIWTVWPNDKVKKYKGTNVKVWNTKNTKNAKKYKELGDSYFYKYRKIEQKQKQKLALRETGPVGVPTFSSRDGATIVYCLHSKSVIIINYLFKYFYRQMFIFA